MPWKSILSCHVMSCHSCLPYRRRTHSSSIHPAWPAPAGAGVRFPSDLARCPLFRCTRQRERKREREKKKEKQTEPMWPSLPIHAKDMQYMHIHIYLYLIHTGPLGPGLPCGLSVPPLQAESSNTPIATALPFFFFLLFSIFCCNYRSVAQTRPSLTHSLADCSTPV